MVVRYFDVIVIAKPALPRWQNPHPHANAGERPACQFARVAVVNRHVFLEDRSAIWCLKQRFRLARVTAAGLELRHPSFASRHDLANSGQQIAN
jgi:hypothetical protein